MAVVTEDAVVRDDADVVRDNADAVVTERAVVSERERHTQISWGAIFAGMALAIATTWLMFLLGAAIGVSVADASDMEAVGEGFGIGSAIWMILSGLLAFFVGSLLAARLSGNADETAGMLHGVTLWSVATVLMMFLAYQGVAGLVQTTANVATSAVDTAVNAALTAGNAAVNTGQAINSAAQNVSGTPLAASISAKVKREAADQIAKREASGGADVTQAEAARALEQLDPKVFREMATELVNGDKAAAKKTLSEETDLANAEINEIVDGVASAIDDSAAVEAVQTQLQQAARTTSRRLSKLAGPGVNQREIREAMNQVDGPTLQAVAMHLVQGEPQAAKDVLAANTTLTEPEVNSVVEGVDSEVKQEVEEFKTKAAAVVEKASDYTQAVLWAAFATAAIGLLTAILGGWVGASTVERLRTVAVTREARV